jgi:hypothetical protein
MVEVLDSSGAIWCCRTVKEISVYRHAEHILIIMPVLLALLQDTTPAVL